MLYKSLFLGVLPTLALARPQTTRGMRCTNEAFTEEQTAFFARVSTHSRESRGDPFSVPTYFHVVAESDTNGNIGDDALNAQLQVLNQDFGSQGISFTLVETTRTINAAWATNQDGDNMRQTLRKGSYNALNVFFMTNPDGALGYCSLPGTVNPGEFWHDGCAVASGTVPGGNPPYDLGKTATHEIGHWLGLPHTFDNGCSEPGDGIDDTPYEAQATFGCPVGQDSCPGQEGLDPIQNFMDYTDDACMTEFTGGQGARMHDAWYNIRVPQSS